MDVVAVAERVEVHMRNTNASVWYMAQDPLLRSTVVTGDAAQSPVRFTQGV